MSQQLRDYDFLARYAGDEFVAIIPETDKKAVSELCERIEKAVIAYKLPVGEDHFASVGVSLGAASYPQNGESFDQVVVAADKAMYAVKGVRKQKRAENLKKDNSLTQAPIKPIINQTIVEARTISPASNKYKTTKTNQSQDTYEDGFIVELDESHIVSSAVN